MTPVPRKLLVVDDDVHIRRLIRIYLRDLDLAVDDCGNGEEAIALASSDSVDIALIDVILPMYGGLRLAQKLRASNASMRIVLMSGDASQRDPAIEQGADAFLLKPFTKEELVATLLP